MSANQRPRDPVRVVGWWLRWGLVPALIGVWVSGNIDARSLPFFGAERESAVLLQDGQAYFGHLDDSGESGWLVLRDVYYFQDATGAPTNVAVALQKRGGEAHEPADGMRINRDRVLAVERVGADSGVAKAIEVEREILRQPPAALTLNRAAVADADTLATQRIAAEHAIARGFKAQTAQLTKLNTELVLPVSKDAAAAITAQAISQLHDVRRAALATLGAALGLSPADAEAYARRVDPTLDSDFANDPGVLLAPDLNAVVVRATALYVQVGDAAAKQLTQPSATGSPSPSPRPSATPSPAPSTTTRP